MDYILIYIIVFICILMVLSLVMIILVIHSILRERVAYIHEFITPDGTHIYSVNNTDANNEDDRHVDTNYMPMV